MKHNVGSIDRVIRIVLFVLLSGAGTSLIILKTAPLWIGIVLIAVGVVLLLTAVIRLCPIYLALGINTGKEK